MFWQELLLPSLIFTDPTSPPTLKTTMSSFASSASLSSSASSGNSVLPVHNGDLFNIQDALNLEYEIFNINLSIIDYTHALYHKRLRAVSERRSARFASQPLDPQLREYAQQILQENERIDLMRKSLRHAMAINESVVRMWDPDALPSRAWSTQGTWGGDVE
jgi:hypothetical protein